jgi:hypothetical protein
MNKAPRSINSHIWEKHPESYYVEPRWVNERLFEDYRFDGPIFDPACGLGRIVSAALACGYAATGSDIVRRSDDFCDEKKCFTHTLFPPKSRATIISNPPYQKARELAQMALGAATSEVALLLPSKWLFGDTRSRWLEETPLWRVLALTPRPSMPPGPVIEAGITPGGGREDFAWFIWKIGYRGSPTLSWLRRDG